MKKNNTETKTTTKGIIRIVETGEKAKFKARTKFTNLMAELSKITATADKTVKDYLTALKAETKDTLQKPLEEEADISVEKSSKIFSSLSDGQKSLISNISNLKKEIAHMRDILREPFSHKIGVAVEGEAKLVWIKIQNTSFSVDEEVELSFEIVDGVRRNFKMSK